jgi:tripartite-type tricarboxylate transporter receptor subunit TctC
MRQAFGWIAAASMLLAAAGSHAQSWPGKPIRIVVPFSTGGPTDITTRNIAPRLTELLGQPVVVDNRAGANGIIGAEVVAKAPPDGYSLLMATASVAAINMVTYKNPPYDTLRDLQPLSPIMTTGSLLVVHPSMPAKSVKDLVALAKAKPAAITFGSAGTGGTLHLLLEMLLSEARIRITHVPYKGAAPAVTDVIAGQINGMFVDLPVISPYVKSGKVRALAVASKERSQYFPELPTTKEAGFPGVEMTNYYGLLVTAKTPREIVTKLHEAIVATVKTPSVREKLMEVGADPKTMAPDEFARFIREDIAKWDKLIKSVGIRIER